MATKEHAHDKTARWAEEPAPSPTNNNRGDHRRLGLAHGRSVELREDGGLLLISREGGEVELKLRITEDGPTLIFDQAGLALAGDGDLDLRCNKLRVQARGGVSLESGGDMTQRVAGDFRLDARDDARIAAQAVELEAELGALDLRANDDLALNGLRVLLNVPSEDETSASLDDIRSFKEMLARPFVADGGPKRLERGEPVPRPGWEESGDEER